MTVKEMILVMHAVHVYWCPVGMHYGVTPWGTSTCPMGCNA